jgi:hypothetical protein
MPIVSKTTEGTPGAYSPLISMDFKDDPEFFTIISQNYQPAPKEISLCAGTKDFHYQIL